MDFDPGRLGSGAECFDRMARAAVGANYAFLLGFGKNVHNAFVAVGPIAFGEAVHETDVNVIRAEFAAKAIEIGAGRGCVARPGLGKDSYFVARDVLEGFGNVWMAAVAVRGIEKAEAVVVAVEKKPRKAINAERGLVRMLADSDGTCAHGDPAGLNTSLA